MEEKEVVSWADEAAKVVAKRKAKEFVCHGMWTPSGYLHIGNARTEIFTPGSVFIALKDQGHKAGFNFIFDDFDELKKLPMGLDIDRKEFEQFIGMPLVKVKSPSDEFGSWAEFFIGHLREVVEEFGLKPNFVSAFDSYKKGLYNETIRTALDNAEGIVETWNRIAGSEKPKNFLPLQIPCQECGNMRAVTATAWDGKRVAYKCGKCGFEGRVSPFDGNAKLHWRVHWAAGWKVFNVAFESGGKDHFSPGGSVDTSQAFCREVFKHEPPFQLGTEFIQIGGAKMAGSVGNIVDLQEWLNVASPETFRYLNFSYSPRKVIEFDLKGNSFVLLNDRFERAERIFFGLEKAENEKIEAKLKRAYELSQIALIPKKLSFQLPYSFAVLLSQLFDSKKDIERILSVLKGTGHIDSKLDSKEKENLAAKISRAGFWVEKYAPEESKLAFLEQVTEEQTSKIAPEAIGLFSELIKAISKAGSADEIQSAVFFTAKDNSLPPKQLFQSLYLVLVGRERGPKIGTLVLALGKERVLARLKELVP